VDIEYEGEQYDLDWEGYVYKLASSVYLLQVESCEDAECYKCGYPTPRDSSSRERVFYR
jgi:hypothetical protein